MFVRALDVTFHYSLTWDYVIIAKLTLRMRFFCMGLNLNLILEVKCNLEISKMSHLSNKLKCKFTALNYFYYYKIQYFFKAIRFILFKRRLTN